MNIALVVEQKAAPPTGEDFNQFYRYLDAVLRQSGARGVRAAHARRTHVIGILTYRAPYEIPLAAGEGFLTNPAVPEVFLNKHIVAKKEQCRTRSRLLADVWVMFNTDFCHRNPC